MSLDNITIEDYVDYLIRKPGLIGNIERNELLELLKKCDWDYLDKTFKNLERRSNCNKGERTLRGCCRIEINRRKYMPWTT